MNYIYDILINFQDYLYESFDWNLDDNITHVRKIPLYKISTNDLYNIINNECLIDKTLLDKFNNKCEIFNNKKIALLQQACLLTDGKEVIAIKCNPKGLIKYMSKLLIDEEYEVLDYSNNINLTTISYKIIKNKKQNIFKTRKEIEITKYIYSKLDEILQKKEYSKLKYLYYECFGKRNEDVYLIVKNIKKGLENNFDENYLKIYYFFRMTINK